MSIVGIIIFPYLYGYAQPCDSTNNFCRPNLSNDSVYKTLFTGYLNSDCYIDTIIVSASKRDADTLLLNNVFLPKYIYWGRCLLPRDSMQYCPCYDTVGVPDTQKVWYTRLDKPSFINMAGKVVLLHISTDTLVDILMIFTGKTGLDSLARDTSHRVILYGQDALDTLWYISLNTIDSSITEPFSALRLEVDKQLIDSAVRDVSYHASYYLAVSGNGMAKRREDDALSLTTKKELQTLRISPNPVYESLRIQFTDMEAPCRMVHITDQTGRIIIKLDIKDQSKEYIVSAEGMKSGVYIANMYCDGEYLLNSQLFVIIK